MRTRAGRSRSPAHRPRGARRPAAQEERFLIGESVASLGFVHLTTEAGRELRWESMRFESAQKLVEDWWPELEDQFIGDDTIAGDCVVLRSQTREVAYLHADVHADTDDPL